MRYELRRTDVGDAEVYFNISDLNIPMAKQVEPYLHFRIKTYQNLNKVDSSGIVFDVTFGQVNKFFTTLDVKDQTKIAMTIISMHHDILNFLEKADPNKLVELTSRLGLMLNDLDLETDMCTKIKWYVHNNIPLGQRIPGSGKRAQDTSALTFTDADILDMLSIALLCKLLGPIFGQMIEVCKIVNGGRQKEVLCVTILSDLFKKNRPSRVVITDEEKEKCPWLVFYPTVWHDIVVKFVNYISHNIKREFKEDMTSIFSSMSHSSTQSALTQGIYAQLLVKNFVNVNLKFDKNIMTYVISTIKSIASSKMKTITNNPVYERKPMEDGDGDENNVSQLENDSIISSKMLDVPAIISSMAPVVIKRMILFNQNLNDDDFTKVISFYNKHPIKPNIINTTLNCIFYRKVLAGGKSVLHLNSNEYNMVTAYLQMYLICNCGAVELGHMLTADRSLHAKLVQNENDERILVSYRNSPAYRNCIDRYSKAPSGMSGNQWEVRIKEIVDSIVLNHHVYHTAPYIWDSLKEDNHNGEVIINTPKMVENISYFIEMVTDELYLEQEEQLL